MDKVVEGSPCMSSKVYTQAPAMSTKHWITPQRQNGAIAAGYAIMSAPGAVNDSMVARARPEQPGVDDQAAHARRNRSSSAQRPRQRDPPPGMAPLFGERIGRTGFGLICALGLDRPRSRG
jgi:hypothetical protein